jgi:predicted lipoprotein with Yx(FWY)xxD motif
MKRFLPILVVVAVAALVIALTSGGSSKAHKTAQSGPHATAPAGAAIGIRSTPLGKILVDAKGRTLYLFEADKPDASSCTDACLSLWPALTTGGAPKADAGVLPAKLGTTATSGGKRQVTYNHHPLYYYVGDRKAGDTTGQGLNQFGAKWYVLAPSGKKVDND